MRLIGRACYPNDGSEFGGRGGIIAHQIGYGKTVVIIALLEVMRPYDSKWSIQQRQEIARDLYSHPDTYFHLKATLIMVPSHLTVQWKTEFKKFGSKDIKVIIINNHADFSKKSLEDLEKADVIIVSLTMWATKYQSYRDALSGTSNGGKGASQREKSHRYIDFCTRVRGLVLEYQNNLSKNASPERQMEEVHITSSQTDKRFPGVSKRKPTQSRGKAKPAAKAKTEAMWAPTWLLENFSFARVVLDEFSYTKKPEVVPFFTNVLTSGKWLLSGTPRLGNLAEVCDLAKYLRVHVSRPDPRVRADLDPITTGPVLSPTTAGENMRLTASGLQSVNFSVDRHQAAERFLRHFTRADKIPPGGALKFEEQVIPADLPFRSRLIYHGIEYELSLVGKNLFDLPNEVRRILDTQVVGKLSDGVIMGEHCLMELATLPVTQDMAAKVRETCDKLVKRYTMQAKSLYDKLFWLTTRMDLGLGQVPPKSRGEHVDKLALMKRLLVGLRDMHAQIFNDELPLSGYIPFGGEATGQDLIGTLYPSPASPPSGAPSKSWWTNFRMNGARFFWPDWFVLDVDRVTRGHEGAALEQLLIELVGDAILFARTHPDGRAITETEDEDWLMRHVPVVQTVIIQALTAGDMTGRGYPLSSESETPDVEALVRRSTKEELKDFLKACMSARDLSRKALSGPLLGLDKMTKEQLQKLCGGYNLKYSDSVGVAGLRKKLNDYFSRNLAQKDFSDGRAFHRRSDFPIPGKMIAPGGGGTSEMVMEQLTSTFQDWDSCQQDLREALRRSNLYRWINGDGEVWLPDLEHDEQDDEGNPVCQHCSEALTSSAGWEGYLVVACGHLLCAECKEAVRGDSRATCPVADCGAFCNAASLVPVSDDVLLRHDDPEESETVGKLTYLVQEILRHEDDSCVVFAPGQKIADEILDLLRREGVTTQSLIGKRTTAATKTEDFKVGGARVLILDARDEHAAGSNLTVANRIYFVCPGMERDRHQRNMHHRQAIGRCLRQGQKKTVFITNLMTENTIEEKLLRELAEERQKEINTALAADANADVPYDAVVDYFHTAELPWWVLAKEYNNSGGLSVAGGGPRASQSQVGSSAAANNHREQNVQEWPAGFEASNQVDEDDEMGGLYD